MRSFSHPTLAVVFTLDSPGRDERRSSGSRRRCGGRRGPSRYGSAPMAAEVTPVKGAKDLREFVALPYRLHRGTPWVPPLKLERYLFLSRRMNAFFKHGEAEYFLARRDGRVVGRATAQIDHAFNRFHDSRWGMF